MKLIGKRADGMNVYEGYVLGYPARTVCNPLNPAMLLPLICNPQVAVTQKKNPVFDQKFITPDPCDLNNENNRRFWPVN